MEMLKPTRFFSLVVLLIACFGCSAIDSLKKTIGETNKTAEANSSGSPANGGTTETASGASPCANKYNPVKDGAVKDYKMSIGGSDAKFVQQYEDGAAKFTEQMTIGKTTVRHEWECTGEGLIAANPGSMMNSPNMKIEPKHISGVTLPKDSEIQTGKTWTTVYQTTGTSPLGEVSSDVKLNNKVVAMDEEITVPAGTYKTVKVETNLEMQMKIGGKNIPVPPIKTYIWYAPGVGMVKNQIEGAFGNSRLEYTGDK